MDTTLHDEATAPRLATVWPLDLDYLTLARFARIVVDRGLEHIAETSWATERMTLEGLFDRSLTTLRDQAERAAVLDLGDVAGEDCFAHISLARGRAHVRVAAREIDALAAAKAWLRERYPVAQPEERQAVSVSFWSLGDHGARRNMRTIDVPAWAEVEGNYPPLVGAQVAALMAGRPAIDKGRLVLWHGEPGTGKTWALRALGWEWRSWCSFHYVTDPETFFGSSPRYMLDVLLDEDDDEERWRLLILEDTGELLAADAKERTGQGLSRLLNVVDGLIGQGLRVIVLVTTNEPLGRLHQAVARPGRCASQIEFLPFTADEAREWLDRTGRDGAPRAGTLASLFARASGDEVRERHPLGFTR